MWREDSEQGRQCFCRTEGGEGNWKERDGWEREKRSVGKGDERVGQLRGIVTGQLCIYWSRWFVCLLEQQKKKQSEKEEEKSEDCSVLLLRCGSPNEECVRALQLSGTTHTSHARWSHSVCWESALPANILRYFQQLPLVEFRFIGCLMWTRGRIRSRWSIYQVVSVCVFAAAVHLCSETSCFLEKHQQRPSKDIWLLESFYACIEIWRKNIKQIKEDKNILKTKLFSELLEKEPALIHHHTRDAQTKILRNQESWWCGLGDESLGGARKGCGCGGWEGKNGLPLPCGTSGCLHHRLRVRMQVLQIVKELVSPSRRRAAARFGGVCMYLTKSITRNTWH